MNKPNVPMEGGCRCDKLRFKVTAAPLITMACHCTGCQKMTASAYSLSALVPEAAFDVTKGEPVIGGLHGDLKHYFCGHCMSWVFTRAPAIEGFINFRATMLDDTSWYVPFIETCVSEKLPWAATSAVHSFEQFPDMAGFPKLIEAYLKLSD